MLPIPAAQRKGVEKQKWRDLDSNIVIYSSTAMPTDTGGYEKEGLLGDADDRQATHRKIRQQHPIGEMANGCSRSCDTTPTLRDMIASRE